MGHSIIIIYYYPPDTCRLLGVYTCVNYFITLGFLLASDVRRKRVAIEQSNAIRPELNTLKI